MLILLITTITYILGSFVAFIVYVFLYLSYLGLLKRPEQELAKRPEVKGFDSMKNGSTALSSQERARIAELSRPEMADEVGFFDHDATFTNPELENQMPHMQKQTATPAFNQTQSVEPGVQETFLDEDSEKNWPLPGKSLDETNDESAEDSNQDFPIVGDLSPDELIQLTSIKTKIEPGTESFQQLIQEHIAIRNKVDQLLEQTDEGVDQVVSIYLSSRDRVLYNAFLYNQEYIGV